MDKVIKSVINVIRWAFSIMFLFGILGAIVGGFKEKGEIGGFITLLILFLLICPVTYNQIKKAYAYTIYNESLEEYEKRKKAKPGKQGIYLE